MLSLDARDEEGAERGAHRADADVASLGDSLEHADVHQLVAPLGAAAVWAEQPRREDRPAAARADGDTNAQGRSRTTALAQAP